MTDIKIAYSYFSLGEFVAQTMLYGIIHPDMQFCNIGFRNDDGFVFNDFADAKIINMPNDLSELSVHQLTESLFPLLDDIIDTFMYKSYFRAGFTSCGGVLGHMIFSNAANSGFTSFLYCNSGNASFSFDASTLYTDNQVNCAIKEWKNLPLNTITLNKFDSLAAYNVAKERRNTSPFNIYYLDNLYLVRSYLALNLNPKAKNNLPTLIMNMAMLALNFKKYYTSYGLFQKCLSMKPQLSKVITLINNNLESIKQSINLTSGITDFIVECCQYDLIELMWILNDLDNSILHVSFENKK